MSHKILDVLNDKNGFLIDYLKDNLPNIFYRRAFSKKVNQMTYIKDFMLSAADEQAIADYWLAYEKVNPLWHKAYFATSGIWDVRYIPENIFYRKIEPQLNRPELNRAYADKNRFDRFFQGFKMPETVIRNMNGQYSDKHYTPLKPLRAQEFVQFMAQQEKLVVKPAIESGAGKNVKIIDLRAKGADEIQTEIATIFAEFGKDFIVQRYLKQHPILAEMHADSLNTLRIISLRLQDEIYILSTILRIGDQGSTIDNGPTGYLTVGVSPTGFLTDFAVDHWTYEQYQHHPYSQFIFKGARLPNMTQAHEMVQAAHRQVHYFDIISWDIALDHLGQPTLIELNLKDQDINYHQRVNGPLFGDHTTAVLAQVYDAT